jgi:hypothetical protein
MSTLVAILLAVIVLGMLLAYYVGYSVGHREGHEQGFQAGKKEGSVRAFAVGYDRGRHERLAKQAEAEEPSPPPKRRLAAWLWTLLVSLLAVMMAAVLSGSQFTR